MLLLAWLPCLFGVVGECQTYPLFAVNNLHIPMQWCNKALFGTNNDAAVVYYFFFPNCDVARGPTEINSVQVIVPNTITIQICFSHFLQQRSVGKNKTTAIDPLDQSKLNASTQAVVSAVESVKKEHVHNRSPSQWHMYVEMTIECMCWYRKCQFWGCFRTCACAQCT